MDVKGAKFRNECVVDNISAHGLYLHLTSLVALGAKLSFVIRLSTKRVNKTVAARLMLHGVALRVDNLADGVYGTAVSLTNYRFLGN